MPKPTPVEPSPNRFLSSALLEAGLGMLAIGLGYLVDVDPRQSIPAWHAFGSLGYQIALGIGAGLLLFAGMWVGGRIPFTRIRKIEEYSHEVVGRLFIPLSRSEIGVLCLSAGVGEELLFRGWLQSYLMQAGWLTSAGPYQPLAALLGASIVFGLCHFLSLEYFIMASLMGLLLGSLFWWSESLVAVIVAHGLYDWLIVHSYLRRRQTVALKNHPD